MVNFLIIGAQKSGTTSLAELLSQHPGICFCKVKEPYFFNRTSLYSSEIEKYHELYNHNTKNQLWGEASTHYSFYPIYRDVHKKIHDYNPEMKIIYLIREPVERVLSLYTFLKYRNDTKLGFEESLLADPQFIYVGRYYLQIKPYLEFFGEANVKILVFEEFIADQRKALLDLSEFLDIDNALFKTQNLHSNSSEGKLYPSRGLLKLIRNKNWFKATSNMVPHDVKNYLRNALYQEVQKPILTEGFRQDIFKIFEEDVDKMEEILGRKVYSNIYS